MTSFAKRLAWRDHFIQKLEDEPALEYRCLHPAHEGPARHRCARLAAWASGQTGVPFVDACMRYLTATGWLNFRMRAMLMSFASYHLWLDWRDTGAVWRGASRITSRAFTGASARCNRAPPASTRCAFTTRSSRGMTKTRTGASSAPGCRNWRLSPRRICTSLGPRRMRAPCWARATPSRSWILRKRRGTRAMSCGVCARLQASATPRARLRSSTRRGHGARTAAARGNKAGGKAQTLPDPAQLRS